jgi:hypothetical protein
MRRRQLVGRCMYIGAMGGVGSARFRSGGSTWLRLVKEPHGKRKYMRTSFVVIGSHMPRDLEQLVPHDLERLVPQDLD